jgi:hypothetical protein
MKGDVLKLVGKMKGVVEYIILVVNLSLVILNQLLGLLHTGVAIIGKGVYDWRFHGWQQHTP